MDSNFLTSKRSRKKFVDPVFSKWDNIRKCATINISWNSKNFDVILFSLIRKLKNVHLTSVFLSMKAAKNDKIKEQELFFKVYR